MYMLDILTIVHGFADPQTASRIRRTCRRLAVLIPQPTLYRIPQPTLYSNPDSTAVYEYRIGGELHRLDGPAIACTYGQEYWYRRGIAHREYHPHRIGKYHKTYKVEDLLHREAGPSGVYYADGEEWYFRGKLHRKMGPANTIRPMAWYTRGNLHRLDGPAHLTRYYIRGIRHRISSPVHNTWTVNGIIIRI